MVVDAQGNAHVMWLDHRGLAAQKHGSHQHREAEAVDGVAMAQHSGLLYAREGTAPAAEREITPGVCYCCKVAMAEAPASWRAGQPNDGPAGSPIIAAAWRHVYPGNIRDIAFTLSHDSGASVSAPVRVSADEWQLAGCPDDGPAMTVDGSGRLHIVWPTVIGGPAPEGGIFHASTTDGKTFSARTRVPTLGSPRPMHPQILAAADGSLVVAWDEVIQGVRQARGALVAYVSGKPGASVIVVGPIAR
jgi:hypothetical protein